MTPPVPSVDPIHLLNPQLRARSWRRCNLLYPRCVVCGRVVASHGICAACEAWSVRYRLWALFGVIRRQLRAAGFHVRPRI